MTRHSLAFGLTILALAAGAKADPRERAASRARLRAEVVQDLHVSCAEARRAEARERPSPSGDVVAPANERLLEELLEAGDAGAEAARECIGDGGSAETTGCLALVALDGEFDEQQGERCLGNDTLPAESVARLTRMLDEQGLASGIAARVLVSLHAPKIHRGTLVAAGRIGCLRGVPSMAMEELIRERPMLGMWLFRSVWDADPGAAMRLLAEAESDGRDAEADSWLDTLVLGPPLDADANSLDQIELLLGRRRPASPPLELPLAAGEDAVPAVEPLEPSADPPRQRCCRSDAGLVLAMLGSDVARRDEALASSEARAEVSERVARAVAWVREGDDAPPR